MRSVALLRSSRRWGVLIDIKICYYKTSLVSVDIHTPVLKNVISLPRLTPPTFSSQSSYLRYARIDHSFLADRFWPLLVPTNRRVDRSSPSTQHRSFLLPVGYFGSLSSFGCSAHGRCTQTMSSNRFIHRTPSSGTGRLVAAHMVRREGQFSFKF
jgi:hypothetical protein